MGNLIAAAGIAVGVWLGLATSIDSAFDADEVEHTSVVTDASQALGELRTATSALDQLIQSSEAPVELTMGWGDLRDDTLSMSKDMLRDPAAVNAQGMLNRIRSIWGSYATTSDLGPGLQSGMNSRSRSGICLQRPAPASPGLLACTPTPDPGVSGHRIGSDWAARRGET